MVGSLPTTAPVVKVYTHQPYTASVLSSVEPPCGRNEPTMVHNGFGFTAPRYQEYPQHPQFYAPPAPGGYYPAQYPIAAPLPSMVPTTPQPQYMTAAQHHPRHDRTMPTPVGETSPSAPRTQKHIANQRRGEAHHATPSEPLERAAAFNQPCRFEPLKKVYVATGPLRPIEINSSEIDGRRLDDAVHEKVKHMCELKFGRVDYEIVDDLTRKFIASVAEGHLRRLDDGIRVIAIGDNASYTKARENMNAEKPRTQEHLITIWINRPRTDEVLFNLIMRRNEINDLFICAPNKKDKKPVNMMMSNTKAAKLIEENFDFRGQDHYLVEAILEALPKYNLKSPNEKTRQLHAHALQLLRAADRYNEFRSLLVELKIQGVE